MLEQKSSFAGLHVVAMESRRADDMRRLIDRYGGIPHVSPSMREVPLENNRAAIDFANRVITGQVDVIIFLTGVGTRQLVAQIERHVDRARFLTAVGDIQTVVRGPKPLAALKELGISPTLRVPEPNTWRELLTALDERLPVANLVVGLQEYGVTNPSLIAGLEARGAQVERVRVYDWQLPEDVAPLEENVRRIAAGEADVLLLTSANQVWNMRKVAENLGCLERFEEGVGQLVVASIGPTTSEALRAANWSVDLTPEHPKMGQLVQTAADRAGELLTRKRQIAVRLARAPRATDSGDPAAAPWHDSPFLRACRRQPVEFTPVWLMRQAGRYMPEYRAIREKTSFLDLCKNPALSSQVMCQAVERLGVDAAIIFSDLLPILEPMGLDLEFSVGDGPVIHNPLRQPADVDRVLELESTESLHFVMETVQQTRADLPDDIPLIGFAGAPFTLASYAIEGGSSRSYLHTKSLMYRDAGAWDALMSRLSRAVTRYLNAQIAAGAQAVQLFDSWVGCLGPDDYRRFVLPHVREIVAQITPGAPVISFATGNPQLLPLLAEAGPAVVGVDWRIELGDAWRMVGDGCGVQGNLDPMVLLADRDEIRRRVADVLDQAAGRSGHIFNLGHGVLPQTPPKSARAVVDLVHELSRR